MVSGDRGDAAPVVDARIEKHAEIIRKIWWRLEVNIRRENKSRQSYGIEVHVTRTGRSGMHRGSLFRKEVLDDDFLNVSMSKVRGSDGLERFDAI
ncbi:unannotated protein [freshwater metagenome]|uniref:Unannotated protein n=1 Tax=freshwater metagenome TaxID=449393 RepID=A0A6J6Y5F1_9ZZZZ